MNMRGLIAATLVLGGSLTSLEFAYCQGPLTPPGSPAPGMKSLDQVAARTIINAQNTPGDASNQFIISTPGSYYLTGNINVASANGIFVNAADVTIDLNGFSLNGSPDATGNAITIAAKANRCTIKNGNIATFPGFGINCLPGPGGINASGGSFQHLNVNGCGANGISAGTNWTLEHCPSYNHSGIGIACQTACKLEDCRAVGCQSGGIVTTNDCTLISCQSISCASFGIFVGANC